MNDSFKDEPQEAAIETGVESHHIALEALGGNLPNTSFIQFLCTTFWQTWVLGRHPIIKVHRRERTLLA